MEQAVRRWLVSCLAAAALLTAGAPKAFAVSAADCGRDDTCPISQFSDADPSSWYHDGFHYCLEDGLLLGKTRQRLAPDGTLTGVMAARMLLRLDAPSDQTEGAEELERLEAEGFVTEGDGISPDGAVTWEQVLTMLYRYSVYRETGALPETDRETVMSWAKNNGLSNGPEPDAYLTRAQAAELFYRLHLYQEAEPVSVSYDWTPVLAVSLAVCVGLAVVLALYLLRRRRRQDDTPLVDYDIEEDG